MSAVGVKETKDIVLTIAKFANAAGAAMEDGKISVFDIVHLYGPLMSMNKAFEGAVDVPNELAKLDADGVEELKKAFQDEFSIPETAVQAAVDNAVNVASSLLELALKLRSGQLKVAPPPAA